MISSVCVASKVAPCASQIPRSRIVCDHSARNRCETRTVPRGPRIFSQKNRWPGLSAHNRKFHGFYIPFLLFWCSVSR